MGTLRFLLAAAVIAGHSSGILGIPLLDAGLAVRTFFIISGFYMALVLHSKYDPRVHSLWLFYSNRALRIFPMYYCVLLGSFAFYLLACLQLGKPVDRVLYWTQAIQLKEWVPLIAIAISQFTIIGLDITPLFNFNPQYGFSLLGFGPDQNPDTVLAWRFNFLPHTWSISVELIFYAVAPFLTHLKKRWLSLIIGLNILASLAVRIYVPDPLSSQAVYLFAPFQLMYFCLGIITYRVFYLGESKPSISGQVHTALLFILGILTLSSGLITSNLTAFFYTVIAVLCIPELFNRTKSSRIDRFIGELSYPMYLLHIPLKWVLLALFGVTIKDAIAVSGVMLLCVTIVGSVLLVLCVDYPIDKIRQLRARRTT